MQCKFALAFVVACFAMTVSAAPVAEVAVAREPEPLDRASIELPRIVEEAREPCTLYTCICKTFLRQHPFNPSISFPFIRLTHWSTFARAVAVDHKAGIDTASRAGAGLYGTWGRVAL
ncbi:hypothetical protein B0H12DRAFT_1071160 [Mycena haematopus]|nr:hypothetical protein B0H12DRAFT_1071160 [Mycena haematopus]